MQNAATRAYHEGPVEVDGAFAYPARCSDCGDEIAVRTLPTNNGAIYTADVGLCCGPCYAARE